MEFALKTSKMFNARTQKPINNRSMNADLRDGDKIIELHPDCREDVVGIIRNPYFASGQGWGYEIQDASGLHR